MAWLVNTLKTGQLGQLPSLVDLDGDPAILYAGPLRGSVEFARQISSNWVHSQVRLSMRGFIGSLDAEDSLGGLITAAFVDRSSITSAPDAASDVVFLRFDGTKWLSEVVASDAFERRAFNNIKITQVSSGPVIGWAERTTSSDLSLVIAEKKFNTWVQSSIDDATGVNSSWDMSRVAGKLAVIYFQQETQSVKYAALEGGSWTTETAFTLEGDISISGLSLTDVDGLPNISYQINYAISALEGDQRHASKDSDGIWSQTNIERPIVPSGFVDFATSINHVLLPTVAYHIRRPDKINFASLVKDEEYDVFIWVIEEVGTRMAMPSHKHIGSIAYIAAYGTQAQSLLFAEQI